MVFTMWEHLPIISSPCREYDTTLYIHILFHYYIFLVQALKLNSLSKAVQKYLQICFL